MASLHRVGMMQTGVLGNGAASVPAGSANIFATAASKSSVSFVNFVCE